MTSYKWSIDEIKAHRVVWNPGIFTPQADAPKELSIQEVSGVQAPKKCALQGNLFFFLHTLADERDQEA